MLMEMTAKLRDKPEWHLLYFGHCFADAGTGVYTKQDFADGWRRGLVACTHAYAISKVYAQYILDKNQDPHGTIDHLLQWQCDDSWCNSYYAVQPLFVQQARNFDKPSTLGEGYPLAEQTLRNSTLELIGL